MAKKTVKAKSTSAAKPTKPAPAKKTKASVKKLTTAKSAAPPSKPSAVKQTVSSRRVKGKALPHNMTANEPLVGKRHPDEAVPAIEKNVKKKPAVAGKAKVVDVPLRTGTAGGRPGGGSTGELSPARDTAAGRGHGQRRTTR